MRRLSGGAIAGIVIGVVAFVLFLAAAAFFLTRHKRNASRSRIAFPPISAPIRQYDEKIDNSANQLPNSSINNLSDEAVERLYLKEAAEVGDDESGTYATPESRVLLRGKSGTQASERTLRHEQKDEPVKHLPNSPVNRLSDGAVERLYLKDASRIRNDRGNTPDLFTEPPSRAMPRGKLGALTGENASQHTPRGSRKLEAATDERRSVPYRADDFA